MEKEKNKSDKISALLSAANQTDLKVQQTKSVSTGKNTESRTGQDIQTNETTQQQNENIIKQEKGLNSIFENKQVSSWENVRIPAQLHKKIKLLSTASATPIATIITNILYQFYEQNGKDINSYIKKFM